MSIDNEINVSYCIYTTIRCIVGNGPDFTLGGPFVIINIYYSEGCDGK